MSYTTTDEEVDDPNYKGEGRYVPYATGNEHITITEKKQ